MLNEPNVLQGIEKYGLGSLAKLRVFPVDPSLLPKEDKPDIDIKAYLYPKDHECPVCKETFSANLVRVSKIRLDHLDFDLRPVYAPVDPLLYDVIVCPVCGHAAIKDRFFDITERQAEWVIEKMKPHYKPVKYPDQLTVDMAIERYKLALVNAVVKRAKDGEKAYICMKLCWLYRIKGDKQNEMLFAAQTYTGFSAAYTNEYPPIMGLKADTLMFLLAAYAKLFKKYEDSLRYLNQLLFSSTASDRLKERGKDLKHEISQEKQEDGAETSSDTEK